MNNTEVTLIWMEIERNYSNKSQNGNLLAQSFSKLSNFLLKIQIF